MIDDENRDYYEARVIRERWWIRRHRRPMIGLVDAVVRAIG